MMSHFGNAFCNSTTPAFVTLVSYITRKVSFFNAATSLRPVSGANQPKHFELLALG